MVAKRSAPAGTDERKAQPTGADKSVPDAVQLPDLERRLGDVEPWAALLEQLVEVPEESEPAERGSNSEQGRAAGRRLATPDRHRSRLVARPSAVREMACSCERARSRRPAVCLDSPPAGTRR
jgi:hypothetical protein